MKKQGLIGKFEADLWDLVLLKKENGEELVGYVLVYNDKNITLFNKMKSTKEESYLTDFMRNTKFYHTKLKNWDNYEILKKFEPKKDL